ncbi:MAG: hypothetical protein LBT65_02735 [Synergistaceae bacterium]|nr:hypothetical protein [Synergistaceae bacterium]
MPRLRRFFALSFVFALLVFSPLFSPVAWAGNPEDALSARPDESIYLSARVDDPGGMLRHIFSRDNVDMLASLMPPQELQGLQLVASVVAQIPVKSLALAVGTTADETPFLQIAASMPPEQQAKLDRVAAGKADAADVVTLLLGEGGLLLAAGINPKVQTGEAGPYYTVDGGGALSARDDLLLVASSPKDLQDSLNALADAKKRLAPKRKFDSPDYYFLHIDISTIEALTDDGDSRNAEAMKTLKSIFKAPLEFETAFDLKPDSFLISCAANILESLSTAERIRNLQASAGGGIFLAGAGKLLFGVAGITDFSASNLKVFPEAERLWARFIRETSRVGIEEKDIENLLTGSFSLVGGSNATLMGRPAPGMYVALTGREGVAGSILKKLLADPDFTNAVPMSPLKVSGWDPLVRVDPALVPVPLLVGARGDTLFFGVVDPDGLDKKPEVSPAVAGLLEKKLIAGGFIDVVSIWDWLRREVGDVNSPLGAALESLPKDQAGMVGNILNADLPVSFIRLWNPALEASFIEFSLVDVPAEKRLLPRLLEVAKALGIEDDDEFDDEESPLATLLVLRGMVEAQIAQEPELDLEDLEVPFAGATFLEKDGDIWIGLQVGSDEDKLELIENAAKFGLSGSAGLGIAPDGSTYEGQEAVWIRVEK